MKQQILIALAIIFIIAFMLLFVRFVFGGDEDAWICSDGQWIKHGNPSSQAPTTPCMRDSAVQGNGAPSF